MKSLSACSLYTFVDTAYLRDRDPVDVARELCAGGSDIIQFRAKHLLPKEIAAIASKILKVTNETGIPLVINDYPGVAREIGAPLVHLGQEDFFESRVGEVPRDLAVGLSTHSPEQAKRAIAANPAYIAIGPVYATPTKPTAIPVTLDYVRWAAANVQIPWFAIGGINLQNVDEVIAAGAKRICVVSAILNAVDIRQACQIFKQRLSSAARKTI